MGSASQNSSDPENANQTGLEVCVSSEAHDSVWGRRGDETGDRL